MPYYELILRLTLLARVLAEMDSRGKRGVVGWFAGVTARPERWQAEGFVPVETPHQQCVRISAPDVSVDVLREQWYQTMGDLDFF